jgi:hypothetical protein
MIAGLFLIPLFIGFFGFFVYKTTRLVRLKNKYEGEFVDWNGVIVYVEHIYDDGKMAWVRAGRLDYAAQIKDFKPIMAEVIPFPTTKNNDISM